MGGERHTQPDRGGSGSCSYDLFELFHAGDTFGLHFAWARTLQACDLPWQNTCR